MNELEMDWMLEADEDLSDDFDNDPEDLEDDMDDDPEDDFDDDFDDLLDDNPDDDFTDDFDDLGDVLDDDPDDDPDDDFTDDFDDGLDDDPDDDLEAWNPNAFDEEELGDLGELGAADNYENFDPHTADMEDVIGDVEEDMNSWHEQEGNTCAVCAQEFVLEALTGREFDMDELRELAEENGWYNNGTLLDDVGNLLEYHGLQVERITGAGIEDIENCLNAGGKVIAGVDSSEIWSGERDDLLFPGFLESDGHAVQVIGLDYSNPEEPMVILNDSGVANGCGAMVSLDVFEEALDDYGGFIVTAYN